MEEENEESAQEEGVVEDKEAERVLPSLLQVDLEQLAFEYSEVLSDGELLSESQGA